MDWTLEKIKAKIRLLTARPDTSQLSDEDLLEYVNEYFVNRLPQEIPNAPTFKTWFELSVSSGDDGEYALSSEIQRVLPGNWTCTDSDGTEFPVDLSTDYETFFAEFPDDYDTTARPEKVLLYGDVIYVRPLPDDDYTIKFPACVANVLLSADSDTLDEKAWGPLIAYGAAIDILVDYGQLDEAKGIGQAYSLALANVARKNILHMPVGQRAAPSF